MSTYQIQAEERRLRIIELEAALDQALSQRDEYLAAWQGAREQRDRLAARVQPHMCRMGHVEIHHSDSGDDERCPLCRARDALETIEDMDAEELLNDARSTASLALDSIREETK